jgi:hypothetical protein
MRRCAMESPARWQPQVPGTISLPSLPAFDLYSFEPGYRLAASKLTKERSEI